MNGHRRSGAHSFHFLSHIRHPRSAVQSGFTAKSASEHCRGKGGPMLRNLILGTVAAALVATPAAAHHWRHHHHYYRYHSYSYGYRYLPYGYGYSYPAYAFGYAPYAYGPYGFG